MKLKKLMAASAVILMMTGCTKVQTSANNSNKNQVTEQSGTSSAERAPEITKAEPDINAFDLWNKYDKDPDKNTPTYDGQKETVTGVITYIGKDDHGTDSMQLADKKNGTSYVIGVFGSKEEMSPVSAGDTVTISGNFHIMSSTDMVVLKQCQILKIYR